MTSKGSMDSEEISLSVPVAEKKKKKSPGLEFYEQLIKESPHIPGDEGTEEEDNVDISKADWFRPELIAEGKDYVRRNFFSVMLAHMVAVLWTFTFKPTLPVLLFTGRTHVKQEAVSRYLSTVLHVKLWYEGDILDKLAGGAQDVFAVRKVHGAVIRNFRKKLISQELEIPDANLTPEMKKVWDAVQADMADIDETEYPAFMHEAAPCPMSQMDMAITQYSFIAFLLRNPEALGIKSRAGMDGFVHTWAILGRLLGIQDRFNIAIHYLKSSGNYEDGTKDLEAYDLIFNRLYMPSFKHMPEISVRMIDSFCYGLTQYTMKFTTPMVMYYILHHIAGIQNPAATKSLMKTFDKFCYFSLCTGTFKFAKNKRARNFRNAVIRKQISMGGKKIVPERRKHNKRAVKSVEANVKDVGKIVV